MRCLLSQLSLVSIALLAWPVAAMAGTIYKCTDAQGGVLISSTRVDRSCRPIAGESEAQRPKGGGAAPVATQSANASAGNAPAGFPRVAEDMQKARDRDRRHILEEEQAAEQRSLLAARRDLGEQEAALGPGQRAPQALERLAPLRERIARHERNLEAIARELARLK